MHGLPFYGWEQDFCGYTASALVLATFAMQSMRPLRVTAIASNVAFIIYAAVANLHPILVLHSLLLPLNIFRLLQINMHSGCQQGLLNLCRALCAGSALNSLTKRHSTFSPTSIQGRPAPQAPRGHAPADQAQPCTPG